MSEDREKWIWNKPETVLILQGSACLPRDCSFGAWRLKRWLGSQRVRQNWHLISNFRYRNYNLTLEKWHFELKLNSCTLESGVFTHSIYFLAMVSLKEAAFVSTQQRQSRERKMNLIILWQLWMNEVRLIYSIAFASFWNWNRSLRSKYSFSNRF